MNLDLERSLNCSIVIAQRYGYLSYGLNEDCSFVLRTPELQREAGALVAALESGDEASYQKNWLVFNERKQSIAGVNPSMEKASSKEPSGNLINLYAGHFFGIRIGRCLGDDIIPVKTNQYFSADAVYFSSEELPPWDTWIALATDDKGPYLLSWLPDWAISYAEMALELDYVAMYSMIQKGDLPR